MTWQNMSALHKMISFVHQVSLNSKHWTRSSCIGLEKKLFLKVERAESRLNTVIMIFWCFCAHRIFPLREGRGEAQQAGWLWLCGCPPCLLCVTAGISLPFLVLSLSGGIATAHSQINRDIKRVKSIKKSVTRRFNVLQRLEIVQDDHHSLILCVVCVCLYCLSLLLNHASCPLFRPGLS